MNPVRGSTRRCVIVGAGIAGLATALALARHGRHAAVVHERRPSPSEAGAGIQLSPNAVHVLRHLGVADRLQPHVGSPSGIVVRDGASGRVLQHLPLGCWIEARHGAPYWVAHRRDLQAALLDAVRERPDIELRFGSEIAAERVEDLTATAVAVIGADGVFSGLRAHVDRVQPTFSGRTAARTVIPARSIGDAVAREATCVWLAPGSHVVHYPVRQGREIAVIVVRSEAWAAPGWSAPVEEGWLHSALVPFAPALRDMLATAGEWRKWALFEAPGLRRLSKGVVALAGDAAHPVLPFLAQGGCLALEDAVTLAAALGSGADPAAALTTYSDARVRRVVQVAAAARRNGWAFHLSGQAAAARNLAMRWLPPERVMARFDWVYGWRPPQVAP